MHVLINIVANQLSAVLFDDLNFYC